MRVDAGQANLNDHRMWAVEYGTGISGLPKTHSGRGKGVRWTIGRRACMVIRLGPSLALFLI